MGEDGLADQIEDAVTCALQDVVPEVLSESLSNFEVAGENSYVSEFLNMLSDNNVNAKPRLEFIRIGGSNQTIIDKKSYITGIWCRRCEKDSEKHNGRNKRTL